MHALFSGLTRRLGEQDRNLGMTRNSVCGCLGLLGHLFPAVKSFIQMSAGEGHCPRGLSVPFPEGSGLELGRKLQKRKPSSSGQCKRLPAARSEMLHPLPICTRRPSIIASASRSSSIIASASRSYEHYLLSLSRIHFSASPAPAPQCGISSSCVHHPSFASPCRSRRDLSDLRMVASEHPPLLLLDIVQNQKGVEK